MSSILNTFYILFKSNADDVIKGNKAVEKSTKELEENLKKTNEQAGKLGESYVKMMESAAGAAGAFAGFNIIKANINTAAEYNLQLKVMGDLGNQNAQVLKTMALAAEAAGGSAQGALGDIRGLTAMAASSGKDLGPIDQYFGNIRERLRGRSKNEQQLFLSRVGINDPGLQRLLRPDITSDVDFKSRITDASGRSRLTKQDEQTALDKRFSDSNAAAEANKFGTNAGTAFIEAIKSWNGFKGMVLDSLSQGTSGAVIGSGLTVGGLFLGGRAALRGARSLLGFGAKAAPAAVEAAAAGEAVAGGAVAAEGAAAGTGTGIAGAIGTGAAALFAGLVTALYPTAAGQGEDELMRKLNARPGGGIRGSDDPYQFFKDKGYSDAQIAGIISNIQYESNGDPRARGDGGKAVGSLSGIPIAWQTFCGTPASMCARPIA